MQTTADIGSLASILQYCESFAKQMLSTHGEFHSFGSFLSAKSGKIEALGAYAGVEMPTGAETYQLLDGFIKQGVMDGTLLAYGIAANVNIPEALKAPFPDGIRIQVEAQGYSRVIYIPYRILPFPKMRRFLAVFPVVQYADEIAVDVADRHFRAGEA